MSARLLRGGRELWLDGAPYISVLDALHRASGPVRYLEIGVLAGETLKLASGLALGVDPAPRVPPEIADRPGVRLFSLTSDAFFAAHDPAALLGAPVQLAFLDGLHQFEVLLRDLIHTERACAADGLILLHDGLPRTPEMTGAAEARRGGRYGALWTGDVWKLIPILRRLRPDLEVRCLDAAPTGLVAVSRLDPRSRVLSDAYDALTAEWAAIRLEDYGLDRLFADAQVESAAAWLNTRAPFHDPRPSWKVALKRLLRRP